MNLNKTLVRTLVLCMEYAGVKDSLCVFNKNLRTLINNVINTAHAKSKHLHISTTTHTKQTEFQWEIQVVRVEDSTTSSDQTPYIYIIIRAKLQQS